jgi:hypothetical protein
MSAFRQKRDQVMKPFYDSTLAFARVRDVGPAEQALLKAILISPLATRDVAYGMLPFLPQILSAPAYAQTKMISQVFSPAPEPAKS